GVEGAVIPEVGLQRFGISFTEAERGQRAIVFEYAGDALVGAEEATAFRDRGRGPGAGRRECGRGQECRKDFLKSGDFIRAKSNGHAALLPAAAREIVSSFHGMRKIADRAPRAGAGARPWSFRVSSSGIYRRAARSDVSSPKF